MTVFNCNTQKNYQTISRMNNAIIAIDHHQKGLCLVNASKNDLIVVNEFVNIDGSWIKKHTASIKGKNTDGGKPQYFNNDHDLLFATQAGKLWRYSCDTGECECIWQKQFSDQSITFDVYEDMILIALGASENACHVGYDVIETDGSIIQSLRFEEKDPGVIGQMIRAKWLNREEIIAVHQLSIDFQYDILWRIKWKTAKKLAEDKETTKISRPSKTLFDFQISPDRQYLALVWLNWNKQGAAYQLGLYSMKELELLYETEVEFYSSMSFSENSRYLLICSLGSYFTLAIR